MAASPRTLSSSSGFISNLNEKHERGRRRDAYTEGLRPLMVAILSEAINRFQRNLFETSLHGRCGFVEAEFWLFRDRSKALFSFNNVCDFLSLDPQHIRLQLRDRRRSQLRA